MSNTIFKILAGSGIGQFASWSPPSHLPPPGLELLPQIIVITAIDSVQAIAPAAYEVPTADELSYLTHPIAMKYVSYRGIERV